MKDPTQRFTSKAESYANRWDYEPEAFDALLAYTGLRPGDTVADLGSGTGMVARHLLEKGLQVIAVEPNEAMRVIAERDLGHYPGFHSLNARAEETGLPEHSIALATAGRAFHWFEPQATNAELRRILQPPAWLAILYVEWLPSAFQDAVRAYVRTPENGWEEGHGWLKGQEGRYFGHDTLEVQRFTGRRTEDWDAFWGRLMSFSISPEVGTVGHEKTKSAAREVFAQYAPGGVVEIPVATMVTIGKVQAYVE